MLRVVRLGGDLGVAVRGLESERSVLGIVERMDHVVRRARMVWLLLEELDRDRAGLHLPVEAGLSAADQTEIGKRVERLGLVVFRVRLGEPPHRLVVELVAFVLVAGAVEDFHGVQIKPLTLGGGLGPALGAGRPEPLQDVARGADVLLGPQWVVVADRLTPVGEGEIGVDFLRVLERFPGLLEPEAVERGYSALESLLRGLRAGVREIHFAEVGLFGEGRCRHQRGVRRKRARGVRGRGVFWTWNPPWQARICVWKR